MTFQDLRNDGFTIMKRENIDDIQKEIERHLGLYSSLLRSYVKWPVIGKEKKMDKNSWTYKFGYALGRVVTLCAVVAIVALTCRFIMWLF